MRGDILGEPLVLVRKRHALEPARVKRARYHANFLGRNGQLGFVDYAPHIRLAQRIVLVGGRKFAQSSAIFADSRKQLVQALRLLEIVLPKSVVVKPRHLLNPLVDRLALLGVGLVFGSVLPRVIFKRTAARQVAEAHLRAVFPRPNNRLILGRKLRERVQNRSHGRDFGVRENCRGENRFLRAELFD